MALDPILFEVIGEDDPAPLPEAEGGGLVLYLDTSALIKLYIEEAFSDVVEHAVSEADEVATSEIANLEARAALARLYHEGRMSADDLDRVLGQLKRDLDTLDLVLYDADLARAGGDLAGRHGDPPLRAYDALHLASAQEAFRLLAVSAGHSTPRVLAFDRRLVRAARVEGLRLYFDPFPGQETDGG
ncbi:MAG: type II toxin-antitoxin system VapC family toxin [Actinomycetota bacterium]|nr:type II toxin-antitoxin system VapC family toxin [Actinomycetota bacterium]